MIFRKDKGTGYYYAYLPNHPAANSAGKVLEHVAVMSEHIGRSLASGECVHHKDRNRQNNRIDNLQLMTQSDHAKLHQLEDNDYKEESRECPNCSAIFDVSVRSLKKYCTYDCAKKSTRKFEIGVEELRQLVWSLPTTEIAKTLGVSDKAVAKRCKVLGVTKPPRGYWAKAKAGIV